MKCLCPLEDRECPGNCSRTERAKRRGARAEQLYQQGFTMEQIATQLGVTQGTISKDLGNLFQGNKLKPAKTSTNPKGAGRPKGKTGSTISGRRRIEGLTTEVERDIANAVLDEGKTLEAAVAGADVGSVQQAKIAVAYERGRRDAFNELLDAADVANFSDKGKLKIEDAIRIHKARLDKQFQQRVNEEVIARIAAADDATRKHNKQLLSENINLQRMVGHRGVFTKTQFRQMQMLCHPDNSASPQLRAELSQILVENEKKIVKAE